MFITSLELPSQFEPQSNLTFELAPLPSGAVICCAEPVMDSAKFEAHIEFYGRMRMAFFQS